MNERHRQSRDALRARTSILPQAKSWRRADPLRPSMEINREPKGRLRALGSRRVRVFRTCISMCFPAGT